MNNPQENRFFKKGFTGFRIKLGIAVLFLFPLLQACGVLYPNRILKTDKDYNFQTFLDSLPQDFIIQQGDQIELNVYPKKGYILIESQISTINENNNLQTSPNSLTYLVDAQGEANLPILGLVKLIGLTEREAEEKLAALYATNYIDPFVNLNITNKSIVVYRGSSEAKEIAMLRPDMTVLDAIAISGGMPVNSRSAKVRILRNDKGDNMIESIDLSEMKDLAKAQSYVIPNDVIYIEPGINADFFSEISPIITTVSSIIIIYAFFVNLNNK